MRQIHRPGLYYVYILRSLRTHQYYVGSTKDVENRLYEHNSGKSSYTRTGAPWELVHTMVFQTRSEAVQCERKIKARGIERYLAKID